MSVNSQLTAVLPPPSAVLYFTLDAALATVGSVTEVLYVDNRTIDAVVLADSAVAGASVICRSINILFTLINRLRHMSSCSCDVRHMFILIYIQTVETHY